MDASDDRVDGYLASEELNPTVRSLGLTSNTSGDVTLRTVTFDFDVVDEVGFLPFEQDAANLFFQLVSSRNEHASLILTSNLPFSGWGGVFGDQAVAAAMIDRVVHDADVLTLTGARYRLRNRGIDTLPIIRTQDPADQKRNEPVASLSRVGSASFSSVADTTPNNRNEQPLTCSRRRRATLRSLGGVCGGLLH